MVVVARSAMVSKISHYEAQILALVYATRVSLFLLRLVKIPG